MRGQNVTDFGTKYYSETVCHTVMNCPNLLVQNVTIWGGRTIRNVSKLSQQTVCWVGTSFGSKCREVGSWVEGLSRHLLMYTYCMMQTTVNIYVQI
jgi:hypothetical protein